MGRKSPPAEGCRTCPPKPSRRRNGGVGSVSNGWKDGSEKFQALEKVVAIFPRRGNVNLFASSKKGVLMGLDGLCKVFAPRSGFKKEVRGRNGK